MFQTDLEVLKRAVLLCMIGFCTANTHMTMELDSVDDQYTNCRDSMLQRVIEPGGLLETELETNPDYWEAWKNGRTCMRPVPGAGDEQNIALAVFTSDFNFYDKFSYATKLHGINADIYNSRFPYKSLHFLLTDVFRLMNKTENCYEGISGSHTNLASTEINTTVRMGNYIWGSPFMERFCITEYLVKSCHAVDVSAYSCLRDIDVVIPPYETFNVTNVEVIHNDDPMVTRPKKIIISLTSIGAHHEHNCSFFTRTTATTASTASTATTPSTATTSTATTSPGSCVLPPIWGLLVLLALSLCLTKP